MKEEFCIMPENPLYSTTRFYGSHRHEVFEGRTGNRDKSIEDGLVIFLTPEMHNMSNAGIHFNKKFRQKVQKIAQETWQEYYNKTEDDFRKRYGKSFL